GRAHSAGVRGGSERRQLRLDQDPKARRGGLERARRARRPREDIPHGGREARAPAPDHRRPAGPERSAPRRDRLMRIGLGGLAFALLARFTLLPLAGCAEPTVVRVIDGHTVEGRFISSAAYALYARAVQEEAAGGSPARALASLKQATEEDPASA